jgi:MSHA biogenesis protein MshK
MKRGRMKRCVAAFAVALCAASANAQALNDPMRPPAFAPVAAGEAPAKAAHVLQSIVIGKDRRYAIIDGMHVDLNGTIGDAKVIRIVENSVTLRDDSGDTVLTLYPEVKKLIVAPKSPTGRGATKLERGSK